MFKKLYKITLILIISLVMVSCGKKEKSEDSNKNNKSKTISTAIAKKDYNFDPRFSKNIYSDSVITQLFEGLTKFSSENKIVLNQAEKIEKNEDFTKWTITLRNDIKWSDGSDVTATDYVSSWLSILNKNNNNPNYYRFLFIKDAKKIYDEEEKILEYPIKAIGNKRIEVQMEFPVKNFDEFLANVWMFPVKYDMHNQKFDNDKFVSNAAFKFKESNDKKIILEKNEHFWDAANVRFDKVELLKVKDAAFAYQLFNMGKIDFFGLPFYEISYERREDAKKRPELLNFKTNIWEFLTLDTTSPILKESKYREYLYKVLDTKFVCGYVLHNNSTPIFEEKQILFDDLKVIRQEFKDIIEKNFKEKPIITMEYNGTKLNERLMVSIGKEWITNYATRISVQNQKKSIISHNMINIGSTDDTDIKYYINHFYQNDDFSKMYSKSEDVKNDFYILPLLKRSFSVLINGKIQGFYVAPNGHILIKELVKINK